ncbi:hypothetical protein B0T26DRAFT_729708 [Lasiosphaeria miniovina]|uniref:Uncharacterized protein n=1 Tax=Lasiosphaeria miniovina TaxID=1954250 RepID=A0AA40DJI7_9PEZI|nr:uncharacterized protein B0T26DRAFT_729708 [Lasiosphaeria miniovina]KAK0703057.1 hypothetical protein B0T26DRAFT_729708 [Lasiosphaeria miniovina]
MIDRFLDEVSKASLRAKKAGSPLLLIVFCHGVEGYYLCLDNSDRRRGLGIVRLKAALEPGISVTLFTTACFSGGWAITPELNITTLAAAKPDNESFSWPVSNSIGRACGSVFAGATISALSDASTPLLGHSSAEEQGSRSEIPGTDDTCLQPEEPTELQTKTYNEFCRAVTNVVGAWGFSRLLYNGFRFSAQNDDWEFSWT